MSDNRRKTSLREVRLEIIKILSKNPKQAKDLREELKKINPDYGYSRVGLNDILNLLIDSGDIERTILPDSQYPVYSVIKKSKILAEFNGHVFSDLFSYAMFHKKHMLNLLREFENSSGEKNQVDALLEFFGFLVIGPILASRLYDDDKKTREAWLSPVLDLERNLHISHFFEAQPEKRIKQTADELWRKFPVNMDMLKDAIEGSMKIKDLNDKNKDEPSVLKMMKDTINRQNKNKKYKKSLSK